VGIQLSSTSSSSGSSSSSSSDGSGSSIRSSSSSSSSRGRSEDKEEMPQLADDINNEPGVQRRARRTKVLTKSRTFVLGKVLFASSIVMVGLQENVKVSTRGRSEGGKDPIVPNLFEVHSLQRGGAGHPKTKLQTWEKFVRDRQHRQRA